MVQLLSAHCTLWCMFQRCLTSALKQDVIMLQIGLRSNSTLLYSHNVLRISLGQEPINRLLSWQCVQSPYQYQKLFLMSRTAFNLIPNHSQSYYYYNYYYYYYYYYYYLLLLLFWNDTQRTNLKLGVHLHQPPAWPVPDACAQLYHPGRGSHGKGVARKVLWLQLNLPPIFKEKEKTPRE